MKTAKIIAAAAMAGMLATPAMAAKKDPETRLAEKLEGRVAGEPVRCIDMSRVSSSTIYDKTAIVFDAGSTLYVNRPDSGENSLRRNDIMVTKTFSHQLCSVDTVEMRDSSGFWSGVVFLGEFVPYKKVKEEG
ncbi:hypothetical protein [Croceicoccus pelagius]|uniref:Uncharacterized protein n=1 Tax=Croceicoccus pelagius TaxID=1703341 RepID=A0A916YK34_9SPHN|nr:hypothetical protein [Croceicoccus pelagius]GGD48610.1 hypothetical protein GCM10010989_23640 [Croceicoccus pelagius]